MNLSALLEALAAARLDVDALSIDELEEALSVRQRLIDEVVAVDPDALTTSERQRLGDAILTLHGQDAGLLVRIQAAREEAERALGDVANGRTAARGYRDVAPHRAGALIRTA